MIKSTDMSCNFPVALANALAYLTERASSCGTPVFTTQGIDFQELVHRDIVILLVQQVDIQ